MKAVVVLRPWEAKRLIAKAVSKMPEVVRAMNEGIISIGRGSTNAYIVEELLGEPIERDRYIAGYVDEGELKVLPKGDRIQPVTLVNGKVSELSPDDALERMKAGDVFIKGANAVDPQGFVGVLMANEEGGTIGRIIGKVFSRGIELIVPVGLQKLIPSVVDAVDALGIYKTDYSWGYKVGMMAVTNAKVVTEIEAFSILFGLDAVHVSSGGVGDSEGATIFSLEGSKQQVEEALNLLQDIRQKGK